MTIQEQFGHIDIYLFDQILRGNIPPGSRIVDAGCGGGRNLVYFLREGYDVYGADMDSRGIESLRRATGSPDRFRVEAVEAMSFPDAFADVVLSSAVLHFARDDEQFLAMLRSSWRVLRPGGLFFCRLASTIGMEGRFRPLGGRRFRLLDGSDRYLVDEPLLMTLTDQLGGKLVDPLKTSVVQGARCMTTWVVRKIL
jgi:tellurite methyltransferase